MTDIGASSRHELAAQDLSLAPTISEAWPFFARRLHGCALVAHDFDFVIRIIRRHLKAENILHPIPGGICTKEETGMAFDDACAKAGCSCEATSALDTAEMTLQIFEALVHEPSLVELFNGQEVSKSFTRLLSRDGCVHSIGKGGPPYHFHGDSIAPLNRYNDMVPWLIASQLDSPDIHDRLATCSDECNLTKVETAKVHEFLIASLKEAAERHERIEDHETTYINSVCDTLGVDLLNFDQQGSPDDIEITPGMRVCFSGTTIDPTTRKKIPKSAFEDAAEEWGLEFLDSVTKNTATYWLSPTSQQCLARRKRPGVFRFLF